MWLLLIHVLKSKRMGICDYGWSQAEPRTEIHSVQLFQYLLNFVTCQTQSSELPTTIGL